MRCLVTDATWLVPAGAAPTTIDAVQAVLSDHEIEHQTVAHPSEDVGVDEAPGVGVVIGGSMSPTLLDALRYFTDRSLPALVIAHDLDARTEAMLLSAGAFDVVPLPAPPARLSSRLLALHRTAALLAESHVLSNRGDIRAGELCIDLGRREARVADRLIRLTKTEFDLLAILARDPHRVLTRAELRRTLGNTAAQGSLESHLSRIRRKIREAGGGPIIEVVRGVGYRLGAFSKVAT